MILPSVFEDKIGRLPTFCGCTDIDDISLFVYLVMWNKRTDVTNQILSSLLIYTEVIPVILNMDKDWP